MTEIDALIIKAAGLLKEATHTIVLTGAGISTPSGIPDFRTPGSGAWEYIDPTEVASIYAFKRYPQNFYDWLRPLLNTVLRAQPNAAHLALARLEQRGHIRCIITQNIDLLHTKAGSQTIYEVHGHLRDMTCISCFAIYPTEQFIPNFQVTGLVPHCPVCDGVLKPNIILFGEMLPVQIMNKAQLQARLCDLMLVVGSSLEVAPAGDLPLLAKQTGAKVIIINLGETYLDEIADVLIRADVVDVLPQLEAYLTV